ncbi:helix-turn-helix domain-containing protein [Rummeliibacillus stabekisii]|uniref:Helix-turn-helix domain-containing protein n=1 Tax=Rummeliibacillus stabekisii TaxID=241244 RepID=A0A143HFE3_9BACL|nr:helix-turn-helix domain-containing protein [Rummeliibacillus stabekisii]AMX00444.1 hypothetical protein ATY39_14090 [Rummeliibacillus stabekisii]
MPVTMDTKQAADYIGVSLSTLRKYVNEQRLPVLRFPGRRKWLFRKDLIDKWIEEQSVPQIYEPTIPFEPSMEKKYEKYKRQGELRILSPN